MASITQIEQKVTALAVRIAAEMDVIRAQLAAAGFGGSVDYASLTGIPSTFPPTAHTQAASTITDFNDAVDARIALVPPGTPAWGDITGKPAEFPPEDHTHVVADVTDYVAATNALIAAAGAGTGNVFGPVSSTDNHIVLFDGASGNALKDAGAAFSANGLSLVSAANYAAMKALLDLEIGTDVQALSTKLTAVAGMTWAADKGLYTTGVGAIDTYDLTSFARSLLSSADAAAFRATLGVIEPFPVALSDENTTITAGTAKVTFRAPYACIHTSIPRLSLKEPHTAGTFTVDANINGVTMLSTKLTVDANEKTSVTAAAAAVMSANTWDDDDEITVDIDGVGSAGTPKGAKVVFYIRRS